MRSCYTPRSESPKTIFVQKAVALKIHVSAEQSVTNVNDISPKFAKNSSNGHRIVKHFLCVANLFKSARYHR